MTVLPNDLWILDAVQNDIEAVENIERMLEHAVVQSGIRFTKADVVAGLRRLIDAEFVHVWEEAPDHLELIPVSSPDLTDEAINRYWFKPSPSGRARWEAWDRSLDQ